MLTLLKNWSWRDDYRQLKDLFKFIFPKNKTEFRLVSCLVILFFCFAFIPLFYTNVFDNKRFILDHYFSFDNPMYYSQGYFELGRHPLIKFFTIPILRIADIFYLITGSMKSRTFIIVLACNLGISHSILYIYRYLKEIIQLQKYPLCLIMVFYTFMGMNILLSFTIEAFTISAYLLSLTICYYSTMIYKNKNIHLLTNLILVLSLGGVTITNGIKGIIPMFFTKDKTSLTILKIILIGGIFTTILIFMQLKYDIWEETSVAYQKFSIQSPTTNIFYESIFTFWGIPVLMPDVISRPCGAPGAGLFQIIFDTYHSWWQFLFVILLLILLSVSLIYNYKNKFVWIVCSTLLVDIVVHIVLKFGVDEFYLFSGHWLYFIPILLGWLYSKVDRIRSNTLSIILSVMVIILIINNTIQFINFTNLAFELFPGN
ncbi:hypothetical protein CLV62_103199 [Dysgonomonas alginatilytica]|uniref:Dolichyl-phosphate-mannose-protein mannosyltransferase n=1 Tax=Dysgonomonas alginatilytica TaxID=1605892 RepID=A0A2V3PRX3_9BACT|nr:DUF6080 domain-containing protein [Dysgonomonas alginatilytica]PXV67526.1 hypothetical protein CLV62_103199 [Dysgonomonas alginatilytica]